SGAPACGPPCGNPAAARPRIIPGALSQACTRYCLATLVGSTRPGAIPEDAVSCTGAARRAASLASPPWTEEDDLARHLRIPGQPAPDGSVSNRHHIDSH